MRRKRIADNVCMMVMMRMVKKLVGVIAISAMLRLNNVNIKGHHDRQCEDAVIAGVRGL